MARRIHARGDTMRQRCHEAADAGGGMGQPPRIPQVLPHAASDDRIDHAHVRLRGCANAQGFLRKKRTSLKGTLQIVRQIVGGSFFLEKYSLSAVFLDPLDYLLTESQDSVSGSQRYPFLKAGGNPA